MPGWIRLPTPEARVRATLQPSNALTQRLSGISPDLIIAGALTVIGAILYATQLGAVGFSSDEGLTAWVMDLRPGAFLSQITVEAPHYAVYYGVLRVLVAVFGTSEAAIRSLSYLSAVATVPFVYLIGRQLAPGRLVAVGAAVLLIANGFVLNYAVEARVYPFVMLLVTIATWLLLVATESRRPLHWVGYSVVMTAAIWAHFYAFFLVPAHVVWLWFQGARCGRMGLLAVLGCIAASVPIGLAITLLGPEREWLVQPTFGQVIAVLSRTTGAAQAGILGPVLPLAYLTAVAALFVTWLRGRQPSHALILLWIVTPVAVGLMVSVVKPVFILRSMTIIAPALVLAMATAVAQIRVAWLRPAAVAVVTILSLQHMFVPNPTHPDFRSAIAAVAEHSESGDAFINVPFKFMWLASRYYLQQAGAMEELEVLNRKRDDAAAMQPRLKSVVDSRQRLWLLEGLSASGREPWAARTWLRRLERSGYVVTGEWGFHRLKLLLLEPSRRFGGARARLREPTRSVISCRCLPESLRSIPDW